jgi:hypothetical protein
LKPFIFTIMAPRKKDGAGDLVKARLEGWAGFHPSSRPKIERHSLMNRSAAVGGNIRSVSKHESVETIEPALARPTVLVASAEPVIGASMRDLLYGYPLKRFGRGASRKCGFWLIDGTYREIVRLLKRQPVEIPVIIVCAPSCPQEYRDYLAALNLRAFDFLCHPYRKADLERILRAAILERGQSVRVAQNPIGGVVRQPDLRKAG